MIIFENQGEIDMLAVELLGVNVKVGDNPIGHFGTGLKNAAAILLRQRQGISIQIGLETHVFSSKTINVRGEEFLRVYLSDRPLGFTTELGKNWKTWMAYRELYCNAIDEDGHVYRTDEVPVSCKGTTRVIVSGAIIEEIYEKRDEFILATKPISTCFRVNIHQGATKNVFYKGIRAGELSVQALYTYDLRQNLDLTEDRTIKHMFFVEHKIASGIVCSNDKDIIRKCLVAGDGFFEGKIDYGNTTSEASQAFRKVTENLLKAHVDFNRSALKKIDKTVEDAIVTFELNAIEQQQLSRAVDFCAFLGYKIDVTKITFATHLGTSTLGTIGNERIYIAKKSFDQGTKMLAGTIIEEHCHIQLGYLDMTREFQNYLLDRLVSLGEMLWKKPL